MSDNPERPVRVALLNLYQGQPNQGIRCIRELLSGAGLSFDEFDVRGPAQHVPDLSYDIYISSGGPGSPFDGVDQPWEAEYFQLLDSVWSHNLNSDDKKFFLAICHSFQLMCIHFDLADVVPRKSGSFGILPVHHTEAGLADPLLGLLPDPFYGADFREWQVTQPRHDSIQSLGATLLAIEKDRPHVPLERAVMAMRISPEILGTQFHPEADPEGMLAHFSKPEQKDVILEKHGDQKYADILHRLSDPDYLWKTHNTFIPAFLANAVQVIQNRKPTLA
jgi:homoserine O-succinyltransferase/O-acetyltransferase